MRIDSPAQFVADFLKGGLWHTTSTDRFKLIQRDGAIRVNPPVQDSQRHKTANGPENYPFVRSLGGVSLFGFSEFEQVEYQARYPVSNWHAFVPVWQAWSSAIWIEIDRDITGSAIIEPQALLDNWKKDAAYGHTLMPLIEAAHLGDIPASAFRSTLLATRLAPSEWGVSYV